MIRRNFLFAVGISFATAAANGIGHLQASGTDNVPRPKAQFVEDQGKRMPIVKRTETGVWYLPDESSSDIVHQPYEQVIQNRPRRLTDCGNVCRMI